MSKVGRVIADSDPCCPLQKESQKTTTVFKEPNRPCGGIPKPLRIKLEPNTDSEQCVPTQPRSNMQKVPSISDLTDDSSLHGKWSLFGSCRQSGGTRGRELVCAALKTIYTCCRLSVRIKMEFVLLCHFIAVVHCWGGGGGAAI